MRYPEILHLSFFKTSIFFVVLVSAGIFTAAYAADYNIAWPEQRIDKKPSANNSAAASISKAWEKRKGVINIASGMLGSDSPVVKGDTVTVSFFADAVYRIKIDNVKHHPDGTTVFSGKPAGSEMSVFTMTADSSNFLMTLKDIEKNMTYRVTGKMSGSRGNVKELDIKAMPPVKHLPPVKPENPLSSSDLKK